MPGQRVTTEEREQVRAFLLHLVEWSGKSWDELIFEAKVPSTTGAGWRYKQATPQAPALLDLLRVAGVLDESYRLKSGGPGATPRTGVEPEQGTRPAAGHATLSGVEPVTTPRKDRS
jgi:hypothetical protein